MGMVSFGWRLVFNYDDKSAPELARGKCQRVFLERGVVRCDRPLALRRGSGRTDWVLGVV